MKKVLFICSVLIISFLSKPALAAINSPSFITCPGGTIHMWADSAAGSGPGTWSSSDTTVATVTSPPGYRLGWLAGVAPGTAVISYTQATGTVSVTVTVTTAPIPVTIAGNTNIPLGSKALFHINNASIGSPSTLSSGIVGTFMHSNDQLSVWGLSLGTEVISYTMIGGCASTGSTVTVTVVPATDVISGTVYADSTIYHHNCMFKIWLIKYDPSTHMLTAVDSAIEIPSYPGAFVRYQFAGMGTDSFRVKAGELVNIGPPFELNSMLAPHAPTYHTSNLRWDSATAFYHTAGINDTGINIVMVPAPGAFTGGPGFISGDVTTGANKGTADPVPARNMTILCLDDATGALISHTYTDNFGHYFIPNLPTGTYRIFPEAMSYHTTPFASITLTGTSAAKTAVSFIQHTLSHTITPILNSVPSVIPDDAAIKVFPNPADDMIYVQWSHPNDRKSALSLTDITGRIVFTKMIESTSTQDVEVIDVATLKKGIYFLSIKGEGVNFNTRIQRN